MCPNLIADWEARPLSERQIKYAALDAAVPLRLLGEFWERLGEARMHKLIRRHMFTISARHNDMSQTLVRLNGKRGLSSIQARARVSRGGGGQARAVALSNTIVPPQATVSRSSPQRPCVLGLPRRAFPQLRPVRLSGFLPASRAAAAFHLPMA